MNLYNLALFFHVSGDIGIFIGLGIWLFSLMALRRAVNVTQVRAIASLIQLARPVSILSALLTIATGLYMALTVWGWRTGWAIVALVSIIILLPPLVAMLIEPRMHAIIAQAQASADGPLSRSLKKRIHDPVLGTAVQTMIAVVLGIVFLMTTKPSLASSIVVIATALVLGLVSGLPFALNLRESRQAAGSPAAEE